MLRINNLGFISDRRCQKTLFTVEITTNYFNSTGSSVFMAALDTAKAFNHYALFSKCV